MRAFLWSKANMSTISGDLKTKFTDDLGEPLVGGKVYTYHAGTSTPKDSYQDKAFAVVNTNPIVLDDAGSCDLYLNGLYRLRVLDKDGVFVEERDYITQGDSTGSSITDNANNITILQSEVQAINERSVLKLDENNFIIGHGSANSATVHDPAFRVDKLKIAKKDDAESAKLLFNTYGKGAQVEGETVKEGSYIDPDLITQPLVKNWRDVERAALKGTKKDDKTNLLLKVGDSVPENSAASRLVGTATGRLPLAEETYQSFANRTEANTEAIVGLTKMSEFPAGVKVGIAPNGGSYPDKPVKPQGGADSWAYRTEVFGAPYNRYQFAYPYRDSDIYFRGALFNSGNYGEWGKIYTSANTTKDSNGMIKASSPVLRVFSDRIEGNGDGEKMGAKFVKKDVGNYLIKGTTGLADEGWYVTVPQDANGNNLVAVEYESLENGDVVLRTYKRKFDFETASIVADHDNPLDIPDTRWIDLRFNELEQEQLDEPVE